MDVAFPVKIVSGMALALPHNCDHENFLEVSDL